MLTKSDSKGDHHAGPGLDKNKASGPMMKIELTLRLVWFFFACYARLSGLLIKTSLSSFRSPVSTSAGALSRDQVSEARAMNDRDLIRFNQYVLGLLERIFKIRVRITGKHRLPNGPYVLISNHQSSLETVVLQVLCSPLSTVLKKELMSVPILGKALKRIEPIVIDRSKATSSYKALIKQGRERIQEGRSVLIFPQGTRVQPGDYRAFSKGGAALAIKANVPAVPLAHNTGAFWPPKHINREIVDVDFIVGEPVSMGSVTNGDAEASKSDTWSATSLTMELESRVERMIQSIEN